MKGLFIYTGAKGCSKLNSAVFYTNSIFMLDKEWILVVKIVGNQSLAYYQLVYLKLFQCLRESVFPDESIDYTRKHWLSKVALKQFFVAVQSVLHSLKNEEKEWAEKVCMYTWDCIYF